MGAGFLSGRVVSTLIGAVLLLASFAGWADEATWVRYLDAGTAAYNRRDPAEATRQFELALTEAEAFGESDTRLATSLAWLAEMYRLGRRFDDAERLIRRTISLDEKYRGPNHTDLAMSLESLALLFHTQNRQREMEPVLMRALAIYERSLGPMHPRVASSLNNLASLYRSLGRIEEAEPLVSRALAIREKALGPEHPDTVQSRAYLAQLHRDLARGGRSAARRPEPRPVQVAPAPVPVPAAPAVTAPMAQSQPVQSPAPPRQVALPPQPASAPQAVPAPKAVVVPEAKPMPPAVAPMIAAPVSPPKPAAVAPLARMEATPAKPAAPTPAPTTSRSAGMAAASAAAAVPLVLAPPVVASPPAPPPPARREPIVAPQAAVQPQPPQPVKPVRAPYISSLGLQMVSLGAAAARNSPVAAAQAFEVMQLARDREDSGGVARIVARFGRDDQAVATLVASREDLLDRWHGIDKAVLASAGRAGEAQLRAELAGVDQRLMQQDALIEQRVPGYRNYISPQPVSLRAAQGMLAGDEALLSYLVDENASYLMVVRHDRFMFLNLDIGRQELASIIRRLRQELDHPTGDEVERNAFRAFPVAQANQLYRRILAPAEPALQGAAHLMIVGDAALNGLPFAALVTTPNVEPIRVFEDHAKVAWLGRRQALTMLPSEGALRALRSFAPGAPAGRPFIGYGDPVLAGEERGPRSGGSGLRTGARSYSRDALASANQVWSFAPLPETRYALYAMADLLRADQADVHLQAEATESLVKRQDLSDYRVIAFATHGFMADDFKGLAESALVFTPPTASSDRDDGLLTASEIAQLKLRADLVILTATSTAAADGTPDNEGATGLARAFLHAGSRAVLATHWSVPSDATLKLVTRTLRERNRGIGNAEALRRAMLPLMNGEDRLAFAHPSYWAPFMVVGDDNPRTTGTPAQAKDAPARSQPLQSEPPKAESEGGGIGRLLQGIFGGK